MLEKAQSQDLGAARHLLARTGFSESPADIQRASLIPAGQLITGRLSNTQPVSTLSPPSWVNAPIPTKDTMQSMKDMDKKGAQKSLRQLQISQINELRGWWIQSLIQTRNPLAGRLTLFWQNHFTSQHRKVRHSRLMYLQQETLMRHALGSFASMLRDILRDPAMLIYLDNRSNRRKSPNENLARELLELFTLGEGHYKESDIKALAKALTGLSVDKNQLFVFNTKHHDPEEKQLLGHNAVDGLDDVIEVLLEHPATATNITRKLWLHLINDSPDPALINAWSEKYRSSGYSMQALLETLLNSDAFNNPVNHGRLVKSPVELIVGTHRLLHIPSIHRKSLIRASAAMQQTLYDPPNVRGWVGGTRWINSHTLLARNRFINAMLRSEWLNLATLQNNLEQEALLESLLAVPLDSTSTDSSEHAIKQALRSPAYHLC